MTLHLKYAFDSYWILNYFCTFGTLSKTAPLLLTGIFARSRNREEDGIVPILLPGLHKDDLQGPLSVVDDNQKLVGALSVVGATKM